MFRPVPATSTYPYRWQDVLSSLLAPLTLWICVSLTIRYGYFGSSSLVLGPNSSRLLQANSIFVHKIQVRDDAKKGLFLYGFIEKPELSLESNWNVSKYLPVGTYTRRGFSLWLNKGSKILVKWTVDTSSFKDVSVTLTKGNGQAQYIIPEDDSYYVGVTNKNPRSIIMLMTVSVLSMMYETTKAKSKCSTINGLCQLKLVFPSTRFVILTTSNNGDLDGWFIQLSFVARLITYVAILAFVVAVIFLILKYIDTCDRERHETLHEEPNVTEADPLISEKTLPFTYGTSEEDAELGKCGSSEDLYDGRICVICYDEPRNCFFVPCGHCATCYDCAKRTMDGETKVCPICRRFIHKVRRLYNA